MPIEVTVTDVPVTVSASGTQVNATVGGGIGPQGPAGPSGVITVSAPIVNSGTSSAATLSVSLGACLGLVDDALAVTGGALPTNATFTFSDGTNDSEVGPWGFGVETGGGSEYATVTPTGFVIHGPTSSTTIDPASVAFGNGTSLAVGTFDIGLGGYSGISLNCAVGYELNWQAGHLRSIIAGGDGTPQTITCDSPIAFQAGATGVSYGDLDDVPGTFTPSPHGHAAGDIDSESATAGYVLTADGDGGASWGAVDALPSGATAGDVLTYDGDEWTAAAPSAPFDQALNTTDGVTFASVTTAGSIEVNAYDAENDNYAWLQTITEPGSLLCIDRYDGSSVVIENNQITVYGGEGFVYLKRAGIELTGPLSVKFPDESVQTTAWLGSLSYNDLSDLPTLGTAAAADAGDFAAATHAHAWSDITSGVPSSFTPSAHKTSHATGGSDAISASDIGAAASSHTHGNITNAGAIGTTSGLPVITTTSGVLTVGAFGTSSGQFAAGDHTHSQLHDRSHAITSTSDHTAGNWKVFYSNGSGQLVELAVGASGTVFKANGTSSAPTFSAIAASQLPVVLEQTEAVGNSGANKTLSLSTGSVQTVTLSASCTFTMPTATAGASITLILTQGSNYTATFTGVKWPGGTAPTITATANAIDVLVFVSDGTNWYGVASQKFS